MRLLLTLTHRAGAVVPTDHRAALAAWIYQTIAKSDSVFARWLHQEGWQLGNQKYKLFTFGMLRPQRYTIKGGTMWLDEGPSKLVVSFYIPKMAHHLLMGMFKEQRFSIGNNRRPEWFELREAVTLSEPEWQPAMEFQMVTPCCVAQPQPDRSPSQYLAPDHPEFGQRLINNLHNKWKALPAEYQPELTNSFDWEFELLGPHKAKLHRIHDSSVKGFTFTFRLSAPTPLLRIGYYGGFGEKGASLGYGLSRMIKSR